MKKNILILILTTVIILPMEAQKAANYAYKLDNGITVKMEKTWGNVWIQQSQAEFKAGDVQHSVDVNMRLMGELIKPGSTTTKLLSNGKEVKMANAPAGTYDLKITSQLSGKPGTISFDVPGIVVKSKMKTSVNVTLYDYAITIEEVAAANKGLAGYESKIARYKGNTEQKFNWGLPSFYAKGARDKKITPDEPGGDYSGKIKPGTYDVCITIEIAGKPQKVWLENFTMKPDVNYKITTNLNAGEIVYAGTVRDVKQLHLYPLGSADKIGAAKPDKSIEIISYEPATNVFACRPGSYDVLVNIGNGAKYEWKKGIVVRTGQRADVK
jgi:hypothetical protein